MKKMNSSAIDLFKHKMLLAGMINILILSAMLGIQGAGYLGISLGVFAFLVSFHSCWLSATVTRYVRGRNARNQYRSSRKFFRGAVIYVLFTGMALSAVFILFGNQLGTFLIRDIHISICIMIIPGLLLVYGVSEVISGYLQGMGFYMPVKIFYLVRRAATFVGSIAGMKFLREYGEKVANLKHNQAVTSVYGAFGTMLGILAAGLAGLLLLLVFCLLFHGEMRYMRGKDNARYQESAMHGFRIMFHLGLMQGVRFAMLFSPLLLNYILYVRLCKKDGDSAPWVKTGGFLFGEAVPVMVILILGFTVLNHKNMRQLAGHLKNQAFSQFREKVFAMFLGIFVLFLPLCGAVAVMAEPVLKCLTKDAGKEGADILLYAAAGAVLLVLETVTYKLLEIWNETLSLYLILLVSFVAQTAFAVVAFQVLEAGVTGIMLGMMVQALLFIVLFFVKFSRRLKLTGNQLKKLVMAMIMAFAAVLVILLIYQIAGKKLSAGGAMAVSVIPGFLLYLAAIVALQIVSDKEAGYMPGGGLFLRINRMLGR